MSFLHPGQARFCSAILPPSAGDKTIFRAAGDRQLDTASAPHPTRYRFGAAAAGVVPKVSRNAAPKAGTLA
jgi:hypothetical protein